MACAFGISPAQAASHAASTAQARIDDATNVIDEMKQDTHLERLLEHAQGVFIIPHFRKGALIVGGLGGGGVVIMRHGDHWSDPAFFNLAGGNVGLQAGGSGGEVAMMLMTPRAVRRFEDSTSPWTLRGNAGLSIVNYSDTAHTGSNGDVILWTDRRGLYGGLSAGVTHISPDTKLDRAYYQHFAGTHQILVGSARNEQANELRGALMTRVAVK
ncbi:MAG: lipid-binding SYLF domain-containing protein [Steroidobacteraceae bacterium]